MLHILFLSVLSFILILILTLIILILILILILRLIIPTMKIGSLAFLVAPEDSAETSVEKVAQIPEKIVEVEAEKTGSIQITDIES